MPIKTQTLKSEHRTNLRHATTVVRNSMILLALLTIAKAVGGYVTNIVSLTGDAVGSLSDIIAITAIFVGFKMSQRKANTRFTYGFHRVETFISFCIALLIIFLGYKILLESSKRLFIQAETGAHLLGVITSIISIGVSFFAFGYQRRIGEKINSQALLASAYDKRNDALVSLGVLISVVADQFHIPYVEGGVGIGLALLILWTGLNHAKEALFYLLDYWDNPEITRKIRAILEKSKIITAVKNIRLRHAGTYIFGEAFLEVNPFTDSKDLRDEIHRLDNEIENSVEHLGDLVLYINPPKPVKLLVALPIFEERGLASLIAEDTSKPFKFLFVEIRAGAIKKFYTKPNEFMIDQTAQIAQFLKNEKVNILISSLIRPLLYYNLRLNNIKVYPHFLDVKDVEKTVKLLLLDI